MTGEEVEIGEGEVGVGVRPGHFARIRASAEVASVGHWNLSPDWSPQSQRSKDNTRTGAVPS